MQLELKHNFPLNKDLLWNANSLGKINDFFFQIIKITDKFIGLLGVGILLIITSPIILLCTIILFYGTHLVAKKLSSLESNINDISKLPFEAVQQLEAKINPIIKPYHSIISDLEKIKNNWFFRRFYIDVKSISDSFSHIVAACRQTYTINSSELFESEADFSEYQKTFEAMEDIWNYPTTAEDQKIVFEQKKTSEKK